MMIVVFGYPFNKARVNIRPSKFGVSISTPGQGDGTREIAARVAPRRRAVAALPPARRELKRARPPAGEVRRRAHRRLHGRYGAAPFAVALGLRLRNAPAVGIWPLPISVMPPASLLPLSGMGSVCRTLGRVASDLAPKLGHISEDVSLPPQFVGDHRRPD